MAEARMTETVTVGTLTDGVDPETGDPTQEVMDPRYEGRGRIKYDSLTVSDSSGAGSPVASQAPFLSIPTGSPELFEGDALQVTASTADDLLVGRIYTVAGRAQAGQTTSHRYPLTSTT